MLSGPSFVFLGGGYLTGKIELGYSFACTETTHRITLYLLYESNFSSDRFFSQHRRAKLDMGLYLVGSQAIQQ